MDIELQRFRRPINKLAFFVMKKVGPRRREARIQIEIPPGFATFLRQHYGIAGRWDPRYGAEHQRFLQEANIQNVRFFRRLGIAYHIAVIHFKIHSTTQLQYEDGRGERANIHARVTYLSARFSCEQLEDHRARAIEERRARAIGEQRQQPRAAQGLRQHRAA